MPSIKGSLIVTNKDWKYVYNSILNFVNEEIQIAYTKASSFYTEIKDANLSKDYVNENFDDLIFKYSTSTYQKSLIKSALFSGTNNYVYTPKRNNFKKFTNRTTYIDTGALQIEINKKECSVNITTENFDDFDTYIIKNTFLSEFINMVNTIPWPSRTGPSKAIRGCKLMTIDNQVATIFYKSGPRPPEFDTNLTVKDVTMDEPAHLASKMIKSIRYVSTEVTDETSQPLPTSIDNDFDDY